MVAYCTTSVFSGVYIHVLLLEGGIFIKVELSPLKITSLFMTLSKQNSMFVFKKFDYL